MKNEDVGEAVEGDDLAFEFVAESGLDGEQATHREVFHIATTLHGFPFPSNQYGEWDLFPLLFG